MTPGINLDPPPPESDDPEPVTARQRQLLQHLAEATGEIDRRQIRKLTKAEASALIGRIETRHPEEVTKARRRRRRQARRGGRVSSVWIMDLEGRR